MNRILAVLATMLLFVLLSVSAQAQDLKATASLSKDFVISLQGAAGTDGEYFASMSAHPFKNMDVANAYWNYVQDNLAHFAVKMDKGSMFVVIYPHTQYVKGWTATEWNAYFEKNKTKYATAFEQFNK